MFDIYYFLFLIASILCSKTSCVGGDNHLRLFVQAGAETKSAVSGSIL